ncbi:uncharacterized protein LOC128844811 isoform X2 [Malaclemys terrapin pileata]|uniref:uncharacterized protein LOC128844811 isoform X2 n=1 Tax=Malaclemys terrapin pileata TaxID=2991368 RepID=UPI0023A7904D|nr:uncharacterized protein LOC128844811 isoform X2 [Malaclemys terrapin pileata]
MEAGAGGAVVSVSSDWSLSCLCPRSRRDDAAQTPAGWPPLHHAAYQLPRHRYCCRHGDHALKSCCPQLEFESLRRVNLSNVPTPARLRNPLPLLAVGLYGLLILTLMSLDFLHFCRLNQRHFYSLLSSSRLGKRLASSFPRPGPARGGAQRQELPTARPGAAHGPARREEGPSGRSCPRPGPELPTAQPGAAHGLVRSCPRPDPARGGTQRQELPTARPGAAHSPARSCPRPGPARGGTQRQELPTAQPGAAHGPARSCPRPGPARGGTQRQELPTAQTSQDSKCEEPGLQ